MGAKRKLMERAHRADVLSRHYSLMVWSFLGRHRMPLPFLSRSGDVCDVAVCSSYSPRSSSIISTLLRPSVPHCPTSRLPPDVLHFFSSLVASGVSPTTTILPLYPILHVTLHSPSLMMCNILNCYRRCTHASSPNPKHSVLTYEQ